MKFSLIKRIGAAITCAAILGSTFVFSTAAAGMKNISFGNSTSDTAYYISGGAVNGSGNRFADGDQKIVYRIPINTSAKEAYLSVTVSQNYTIDLSASEKDGWVEYTKFEGGAGVREVSEGNKKEFVINVSEYISNGCVYFRIGDQTTDNGHGGLIYGGLLSYQKIEQEVIEPYTEKTNIAFKIGSAFEQRFFPDCVTTGGALNGTYRFMDNSSFVTYVLPIDSSKTAYLNLLLASNYTVKVSVDGEIYKQIDAAEGGEDVGEYGASNKGMRSYNVQETIKKFMPSAPTTYDKLYVKIGDQTTENGWGGQIFYVSLNYGSTGLYNAFNTKGIKSTGIRYKRPQKILTFKTVTSVVPVYNDVVTDTIIDDGAWIDETLVDDVVSEDVVMDETQIDWGTEETTSTVDQAGQPATVVPESEGINWVWIVVCGVIGLVLIGGAVTQFILMENKRKNGQK